jgi:hypothetical protein
MVTQECGTQRNSAVTVRSMLSRRAMLRGLAATAIAAAGQARAGKACANADPALTPSTYHAPQSALDDLKQRLAQTRWPERETVADWSQGVPLAQLRALVAYWGTGYDWRRCETQLNGFAHYRTELDGLNFHFLHIRSRHAHALPLIITHGWPGSVIEFFKIIEPLTNPTAHVGHAEDAFHVVAPSLPGYALADSPVGQAAWIYEKFHGWTDNNGEPESALIRDEMLDNIPLYWLTDTAASSARMYFEHAGIGGKNNSGVVDLPVGAAFSPARLFPRRAVGLSASFPSSFTGTSSIAAAISLRLSSQHCSHKNCAIAFALCADSPE